MTKELVSLEALRSLRRSMDEMENAAFSDNPVSSSFLRHGVITASALIIFIAAFLCPCDPVCFGRITHVKSAKLRRGTHKEDVVI